MNNFSFLSSSNLTIPQIIYAFDPLCGWCYGFNPALDRVCKTLGSQVQFRITCGGLITGEREQPIRAVADYLRQGMQAVETQTGVKFGRAFVEGLLAEGTWVSRSEPACRAVLLVQEISPDLALDFAHALSKAFYYDGLPPDAPETISKVASNIGIDRDILLHQWSQPQNCDRTLQAFAEARSLGIQSYPSLFLWQNSTLSPIVRGCVSAETILEKLKLLLPEIND
jgi:putative protein-disulfide isomerase